MSSDAATAEGPVYFCSEAEFARMNGWSKSYVSKLKGEGRLVLSEAGGVAVRASLDRIRDSTGALERAAPSVQGAAYSRSQEEERFYSAQLKRLEYERETRKVLEAADVLSVIADAGTLLRGRLESWPDRLAPQIAALGADEGRIRALLAEHIEQALAEFVARLGAVG